MAAPIRASTPRAGYGMALSPYRGGRPEHGPPRGDLWPYGGAAVAFTVRLGQQLRRLPCERSSTTDRGSKAWEEVPKPTLQADTDAIVRVDAVTICGTDLHILKGDVPAVTDGRILGHEAVGTVEEVGAGREERAAWAIESSCRASPRAAPAASAAKAATASASAAAAGSSATRSTAPRPSTSACRSPTRRRTPRRRASATRSC